MSHILNNIDSTDVHKQWRKETHPDCSWNDDTASHHDRHAHVNAQAPPSQGVERGAHNKSKTKPTALQLPGCAARAHDIAQLNQTSPGFGASCSQRQGRLKKGRRAQQAPTDPQSQSATCSSNQEKRQAPRDTQTGQELQMHRGQQDSSLSNPLCPSCNLHVLHCATSAAPGPGSTPLAARAPGVRSRVCRHSPPFQKGCGRPCCWCSRPLGHSTKKVQCSEPRGQHTCRHALLWVHSTSPHPSSCQTSPHARSYTKATANGPQKSCQHADNTTPE